MKRFPVGLVAVLLAISSLTLGQGPPPAPVARPGVPPPGAQQPGLPPPRDTNARAPEQGTARLRGRVLALQTGQPLRRAQISLTRMEGGPLRRVTTTDAEGRYEFGDVPAGRFTINATKAGFVTLQYGQRRPFEAGTPLNVTDGETLERIDFSLPKGSVIAVRVTDEFGEPVSGTMVQVQRYQYGPDGQRRLTTAGGAPSAFMTTDDRGEFRAYGLMPGEYVVMATVRNVTGPGTVGGGNDVAEGFAATYYPGTTSAAEAQAISIGVGEEIPVQLAMVPSRMGRVTGTVVDSQGRPAAGASLSVMTVTGNGMSSYNAGTVAPDGSFAVSGLAPGEHTLQINQRQATPLAEFASMPIVVGGSDITGLQITTAPGTTVSGRIVWEGTAARTGSPAPMRVSAQQADPQRRFMFFGSTDPLANGTPDDEGNFTLSGVAGRVFFSVPLPPGWAMKRVVLDGEDVTHTPLDFTGRTTVSDLTIELTDKLTTLAGQVTDARGTGLKDYVVVILPAAEMEPIVASRLIRTVRPDNTGRYETRGMRPGRYVAAAVEALEQGRQFAPEFQQQLRRGAQEFALREGESVSLDLKLTSGL